MAEPARADFLFDDPLDPGNVSLTGTQADYDTDAKPPGQYLVEITGTIANNPVISTANL